MKPCLLSYVHDVIFKLIVATGLTIALFLFTGCNAFMYGYTYDKSVNSYNNVTGDKHNLGDRRVKYVKGFHRRSQLENFLDCKGLPSFIYEYKTENKCRGIKLFYAPIDSVFIFEEPKKGNLHSVLKESRKMDNYERETYARLKVKK